jgi:predicted permease
MTAFFRRLRARIRYRDFDRELRRELDVHRAMAEEDLRADGVSEAEAGYLAGRRLGHVTTAREAARAVWIAPWLESVWQDLRQAFKSLARSPGFTATALATLTLGVGVNTSLFALVNALLLQPWGVPEAHRLVLVHHRSADRLVGVSAPELAFLQERATSVDLAGTREVGGTLASGATTRSVGGRLVSGNYFEVLRLPIALGRGLQRLDDRSGQPPAIVLGHDLWRAAFAADPGIVGRTITFRAVPVTVVGVVAVSVRESPLAGVPEVWLPLASMPALFPGEPFAQEFLSNAGHCCVDLVGRLRAGLSRGRAEAELSTLDRGFRVGTGPDGLGMRVAGTETFFDPEAAKALPVVGLFFTAVALVLLLACANVGNLQLARAAARRRELAIRLALGAGRRRVVRQLLTEGLVLAVVAAGACVAISSMLARAVITRIDPSLAHTLDFTIDVRVLLVAGGLAMLSCLLTSLAPALRATRYSVAGQASDRSTVRLRSTFLAAQVAISVVLLASAVLLGRGLRLAASQDVGFRLDTLMALTIERASQSKEADRILLRDVLAAVGQKPVAAAAVIPLGDYSLHTDARRAGEPDEANRAVRFHPVSPTYFDVLDMPMRSGRTFRDGATNEVVLNETLARMLWPDGAAVGGHLAGPGGSVGREVVGVVADAHVSGLGEVGPIIFQPAESLTHLLFNKGEVAPDALRAAVAGVDPAATTTVRAVGDNVGSSLEAARLGASIAGGVGLLALAIAAVGIAGVFAFVVTERTREVGIRLALGASRQAVRSLLLRRTGGPIGIGVVVGLLMAVVAGLALRSFLYGLSPSDPLAYATVVATVVLTAWAATVVPMRRALRVDPAVTLRHQ